MLLDYFDQNSSTPEHSQILQLITDLSDVLELDCNQRLLGQEPDELINEWIRRSGTLQKVVMQAEELMMDPSFKKMDEKFLTAYVLENLSKDLSLDGNKVDLYFSFKRLVL